MIIVMYVHLGTQSIGSVHIVGRIAYIYESGVYRVSYKCLIPFMIIAIVNGN